jgi:hypothetical protein
MLIVKLLPDQIPPYWDIIKHGSQQVLPPTTADNPAAMNGILQNLLTGILQCWVLFDTDGQHFKAFLITDISTDHFSNQRFLHLYVLYGIRPLDEAEWLQSIEVLTAFAQSNNCQVITGYTNNDALCDKLAQYGFSKDFSMVTKRL